MRAEWADSAMGGNLMNKIPNPVQRIADDKRNRQPEPNDTEYSKHNHRSGFKSPRFLVFEIGGEGQIKSRDRDENRAKKICCPFAENNFCEMKMEPAAASNPMPEYKTIITDSAIREVEKLKALNVSSRELGKN